MPEVITCFLRHRPGVHIAIRAGRNHGLEEEVRAGRLDVAVAFFPAGSDAHGTDLVSLPMRWLGGKGLSKPAANDPIPLVVFDHRCPLRQTALQRLDARRIRWHLSLATPSLPGVWIALRSGYGISVRPSHPVPPAIREVERDFGLPKLPLIELRMLAGNKLSPAAVDLRGILEHVVRMRRNAPASASRRQRASTVIA